MFLTVLSIVAVLTGCQSGSLGKDGYETITPFDIEEEADLTKIAYDFRIHPLKSADPMDGIGGIKCWDDVWLARTNDSRKILRFDNY